MTDEILIRRRKKQLVKNLDFWENYRFHLARVMRHNTGHLTQKGKNKLISYYKKLHNLSFKMNKIADDFSCPFFDFVRKGEYQCSASDCRKCPYEMGCDFHTTIGLLMGQLNRMLAAIRSEFAV